MMRDWKPEFSKELHWKFDVGDGNIQMTFEMSAAGNSIRRQLGEPLSHITPKADSDGDEKVSRHNQTAVKTGRHVIAVKQPEEFPAGRCASEIWPRLGKVKCSRCACEASLFKLTTFMTAKCQAK